MKRKWKEAARTEELEECEHLIDNVTKLLDHDTRSQTERPEKNN